MDQMFLLLVLGRTPRLLLDNVPQENEILPHVILVIVPDSRFFGNRA